LAASKEFYEYISPTAVFPACFLTEDVFDALFKWLNQPGVKELIRQRRDALEAE
jgi:hypothetical protein